MRTQILRTRKTFLLILIFFMLRNANFGQNIFNSNNRIVGNVKKCILKTYSVKTTLDEYDIDELLSKEAFEYNMDGSLKSSLSYKDNYSIKFSYLKNGEVSTILWRFESGYVEAAKDSIVYNADGFISKKITSVFYEKKWATSDIYEYQYEKNNNIKKIIHKYIPEFVDGDIRPFEDGDIYPNMSFNNFSGIFIQELKEKLEAKFEETRSIMYRENSEAIANKPYGSNLPTLEGMKTFTEITFKRDYDSLGNWIKTTIFTGKEPMKIYIREITYYE